MLALSSGCAPCATSTPHGVYLAYLEVKYGLRRS
jgi:hypothetical protein